MAAKSETTDTGNTGAGKAAAPEIEAKRDKQTFLSNFDQDIDGTIYKVGDKVEMEPGGLLDYLLQSAKLTPLDKGDAEVTSIGASGKDAG